MKIYLENLLLFGLLGLALSACSTIPKSDHHDTSVTRETASSIIEEATPGPSNTIIKKEVSLNSHGLHGQCAILEGGNVLIRTNGNEQVRRIPETIRLSNRSVTYSESMMQKFAELVTDPSVRGDTELIGRGFNHGEDGPRVTYVGVRAKNGVKTVQIIKLKNAKGDVFISNKISLGEANGLLEVVDAICK